MSNASAPAYIMVHMKMKDLNEVNQRYGQHVFPLLAKFGGEMNAGSPNPRVTEGNWDGNWAAVLRFPSMADAEAWYNSTEYEPLKSLRINELQAEAGRVVFVEGFNAAAPGG